MFSFFKKHLHKSSSKPEPLKKATHLNKTAGQLATVAQNKETKRLKLVETARQLALLAKEKEVILGKLQESNLLLQETQSIAGLGTYKLDITNGMWTSSEVMDSIFGINAKYHHSIQGWVSIMHPDWQGTMTSYFANEVVAKRAKFNKEYLIIKQDTKEERWVHGLGRLVLNKAGQPVTMIGTIQDITERKKVEELLRESESELNIAESIAKMGNWLILGTNPEAPEKIYWSKELYHLINRDPKYFIPTLQAQMEACVPGDAKKLVDAVNNSLKTGKPYDLEFQLKTEAGRDAKWVRSHAETVLDVKGRIKGMRGVIQDITERKLNEIRLKELDKLKDDFLSVTTHELKSPLIPIKSQTQLLLAGDYGEINKEQRAALEMIYRNEEHLNQLSSEVLDIAKIKSNKLFLNLEKTDLTELITHAFKDLESSAIKKQLTYKLITIPDLPKINIDKFRITQVLNNLLENAIKFTPETGQITVKVSNSKHHITVKIVDTGIGIEAQNIEKLFDPFFQIDSDLNRKYRGTGLGLAISKGIILAHNGKIAAESEGLAKGCTFSFTLPI
jgi:signal transduction histidine kinase